MENYISKYSNIKYIKITNIYIINNKNDLNKLRKEVKNYLQRNKGFVKNKTTGYIAKLNSHSVGKILFPSLHFNPYIKNYIINLMAAMKIKELFAQAIYIDTLRPMKNKQNCNIKGFHYFVAPLLINNHHFRVIITVKENINYPCLYLYSFGVYPLNFNIFYYFNHKYISLKRLVKDVKIFNYDEISYQIYNINDLKFDENSIKESFASYIGSCS